MMNETKVMPTPVALIAAYVTGSCAVLALMYWAPEVVTVMQGWLS